MTSSCLRPLHLQVRNSQLHFVIFCAVVIVPASVHLVFAEITEKFPSAPLDACSWFRTSPSLVSDISVELCLRENGTEAVSDAIRRDKKWEDCDDVERAWLHQWYFAEGEARFLKEKYNGSLPLVVPLVPEEATWRVVDQRHDNGNAGGRVRVRVFPEEKVINAVEYMERVEATIFGKILKVASKMQGKDHEDVTAVAEAVSEVGLAVPPSPSTEETFDEEALNEMAQQKKSFQPPGIVFNDDELTRDEATNAFVPLGRSFLDFNQTYVDIGANIGSCLLPMLQHKSVKKAIAFEPLAANAWHLRESVARNREGFDRGEQVQGGRSSAAASCRRLSRKLRFCQVAVSEVATARRSPSPSSSTDEKSGGTEDEGGGGGGSSSTSPGLLFYSDVYNRGDSGIIGTAPDALAYAEDSKVEDPKRAKELEHLFRDTRRRKLSRVPTTSLDEVFFGPPSCGGGLEDYTTQHAARRTTAAATPPNIRLLKIDAQGHELQILRGAKRLLRLRYVRLVMLELWPAGLSRNDATPRDLADFLLDADYGLLHIPSASKTGSSLSNSGPRALDPFWLRSTRCMSSGYSYITIYALRDAQLARWQRQWRDEMPCPDAADVLATNSSS